VVRSLGTDLKTLVFIQQQSSLRPEGEFVVVCHDARDEKRLVEVVRELELSHKGIRAELDFVGRSSLRQLALRVALLIPPMRCFVSHELGHVERHFLLDYSRCHSLFTNISSDW